MTSEEVMSRTSASGVRLASRIVEVEDAVRDGIFFTKAGLPTVVFVHDFFERAARAEAQALGVPELEIYVYPQHKSGDYEAEEVPKGVKAALDLPGLPTRT